MARTGNRARHTRTPPSHLYKEDDSGWVLHSLHHHVKTEPEAVKKNECIATESGCRLTQWTSDTHNSVQEAGQVPIRRRVVNDELANDAIAKQSSRPLLPALRQVSE